MSRQHLRSIFIATISLAVALAFVGDIRGSDWDNYLWAARTALSGKNPYLEWGRAMATLPAHLWPGRSDLPPLQLLIYMAFLATGGPHLLYALFAVTHAATAVIMDRAALRCNRPGLSWMAFMYAVFPLFTKWFLLDPSNKNIMTLMAVLIVLLAQQGDRYRLAGDEARASTFFLAALLSAALLGNFGWLGFAAVPMIILGSGWSVPKMIRGALAATLVTALCHLPYAPHWKVMYLFRFSRVALPGFHTSPLMILGKVLGAAGLHPPLQLPLLFLATSALCVAAYRRPGSAAKTCALGMIAMAMLRTDADPPTALMSLVIAVVALDDARRYIYAAVIAALTYTWLTTQVSDYGTMIYTVEILVPLILPVAFLVGELAKAPPRAAATSLAVVPGANRDGR